MISGLTNSSIEGNSVVHVLYKITMTTNNLNNINVISKDLLPTPAEVKADLPLSQKGADTVLTGRSTIRNILNRTDHRLFIVVGPCSIHDLDAAREYADKLKNLADKVSDSIYIVMRVYFEKPRTSVGWKGLINDPYMDDSFHIEKGLHMARQILMELAEKGIPTATEALDPITPQYLSDLITWSAIGARTTESQTHREMASGLSTPVGFKNGTDGSLSVAINALHSVSQPHHFLGIDQNGQCAVFHTRGNDCGHVVLRGGGEKPNYDADSIRVCEQSLKEARLAPNLVVDCSHGNSMKDYKRQGEVVENCVDQIVNGNKSIIGFMLESNLFEGKQTVTEDLSLLKYGVSVTDGCIGWDETEELITHIHERLKEVLPKRNT